MVITNEYAKLTQFLTEIYPKIESKDHGDIYPLIEFQNVENLEEAKMSSNSHIHHNTDQGNAMSHSIVTSDFLTRSQNCRDNYKDSDNSISNLIAGLDSPTREEILDFAQLPEDIEKLKADRAERENIRLVEDLLGPNLPVPSSGFEYLPASVSKPASAEHAEAEALKRKRERNTACQRICRQRRKEEARERRLAEANLVPPGFRLL